MEKAIKTFIKEKIENRQNIYLIEPAQIDTDYNRETADWQAYHGRETCLFDLQKWNSNIQVLMNWNKY